MTPDEGKDQVSTASDLLKKKVVLHCFQTDRVLGKGEKLRSTIKRNTSCVSI